MSPVTHTVMRSELEWTQEPSYGGILRQRKTDTIINRYFVRRADGSEQKIDEAGCRALEEASGVKSVDIHGDGTVVKELGRQPAVHVPRYRDPFADIRLFMGSR